MGNFSSSAFSPTGQGKYTKLSTKEWDEDFGKLEKVTKPPERVGQYRDHRVQRHLVSGFLVLLIVSILLVTLGLLLGRSVCWWFLSNDGTQDEVSWGEKVVIDGTEHEVQSYVRSELNAEEIKSNLE